MIKKNQIIDIIQIISTTVIVYFLTNLNFFRYPFFISRYAMSDSIFTYLQNYGRLPLTKLEYFDNYQPIIFISYLLDYFVSFIDKSNLFIGILFFYSFPIIMYLLSNEIGKYLLKEEDKFKKNRISLFNMLFTSFSSYILTLYNETLIFIFIFLLLFIYLKNGFKIEKKFFIIALSGTLILTFYYYIGFLIYTIFFFLLFLFHLINTQENRRKISIFLFLSCLNFWIFFIFYGMIANVGFANSLQSMLSQIFSIPAIYLFLYASVITFYIHILLLFYFKKIYVRLVKFFQKTIKAWILFFIILAALILFYVLINFENFFKPISQNLLNFSFPAPIFDPISRVLSLSNLLILFVPFLLYGIIIIQKLNHHLNLNKIDLLYILSIILVLSFIPIFYTYGALNMVLIRCSKLIVPFALLFSGFFYINSKKFLFYLKNPENLDINFKENINKINSNNFDHKTMDLNRVKRKDIIFYILILQTLSQYLLVIFIYNIYSSFFIFILKLVLTYFNYFIIPGYLFILIFTNSNFSIFEKYFWVLIISFLLVVISLSILNFLSLFYINVLLIIPFIYNMFFLIIWFLNKRTRLMVLLNDFLKFNKKP